MGQTYRSTQFVRNYCRLVGSSHPGVQVTARISSRYEVSTWRNSATTSGLVFASDSRKRVIMPLTIWTATLAASSDRSDERDGFLVRKALATIVRSALRVAGSRRKRMGAVCRLR